MSMLASWVGVQMPRVTSLALVALYFSLAALPPLLSSHASSSVFAVPTPPSRAFACVQWHLSTALKSFAAALTIVSPHFRRFWLAGTQPGSSPPKGSVVVVVVVVVVGARVQPSSPKAARGRPGLGIVPL